MIRVALVMSLVGCVSSSQPGGGGGGSTAPAELAGSWFAGAGGLSQPYDPDTGSYGTPNGQGLLYTLRADGSYDKAFQSWQSANGCTTGFTAFETGSFTSDGSALATTPSTGTVRYRDTCAPSLDSDKPAQDLAVEQFTMTLAGDQLTLVRRDGVTGQFRRLQ